MAVRPKPLAAQSRMYTKAEQWPEALMLYRIAPSPLDGKRGKHWTQGTALLTLPVSKVGRPTQKVVLQAWRYRPKCGPCPADGERTASPVQVRSLGGRNRWSPSCLPAAQQQGCRLRAADKKSEGAGTVRGEGAVGLGSESAWCCGRRCRDKACT